MPYTHKGCCRATPFIMEINCRNYFNSTPAPTSSSLALMLSASAFSTFSLMFEGAPSTSSLASLRPRPVISLTALITLIFSPPASLRTTVNSVC